MIFLFSVAFGDEFFKKQIAYLSSSHNFTQFQKTNHPNRSSGSEDIVDLKLAIFLGFS
jgi:hypothetical protein